MTDDHEVVRPRKRLKVVILANLASTRFLTVYAIFDRPDTVHQAFAKIISGDIPTKLVLFMKFAEI